MPHFEYMQHNEDYYTVTDTMKVKSKIHLF